MDAESDGDSSASNDNQILDYERDLWDNVMDNTEEQTSETSTPSDSTFDLTLPTIHSYLGPNLEELRGRVLLDDGIYMNLPLLIRQSIVLFPGQTLPMTVHGEQTIEMLQNCIQKNRTFGVVCLVNGEMVPIGTTAEIYECTEDSSLQGFRLKAKGRQRFQILCTVLQGHENISANVKILREITLGPPQLDERLASLDPLRLHANDEEELKKQEKVENIDCMLTPWPAWVYRQYEPVRLSLKIREHLRFIESKGCNIPSNPTELSFWVAQNIVLDTVEKTILLNYDCAIQRLQREIKYLMKDREFVCCNCDAFIGLQSNIFPMSKDGPQGAYCNSGGNTYETVTLYHAQGLALMGWRPSTLHSWFPGYAWTIANCRNCGTHMGWKFTAVDGNLRPKEFWGLSCKSLKNKEA